MNFSTPCQKILARCALAALLLASPAVMAIDLLVTTEFKPDVTKPGHNQFVNTTPVSGFCANSPQHCAEGEFSIIVPGFQATKVFDSTTNDLDKHVFITLDGLTKRLTLTDTTNPANQIEVDFRWAFFSVRYNRLNGADGDLSGALSGTGVYPSGGCSGRVGNGGSHTYTHGWGVPDRLVSCYKILNDPPGYQASVGINELSVGYILTTPSPMSLRSGTYEGEIVYRVGDVVNTPGYIGLGATDYHGTDEIRIVIRATVEHMFHYTFPPGSENVRLAPRGGWEQWIHGGRVPESLSKEVPFELSSSSGFSIRMQCEYPQGQGCGLKNTQGQATVPLEVSVTLPGFESNGRPVSQRLLTTGPQGLVVNPPDAPILYRRSQLDFRVQKNGVEQIVREPGSVWRGVVTLIFDTEIQ